MEAANNLQSLPGRRGVTWLFHHEARAREDSSQKFITAHDVFVSLHTGYDVFVSLPTGYGKSYISYFLVSLIGPWTRSLDCIYNNSKDQDAAIAAFSLVL